MTSPDGGVRRLALLVAVGEYEDEALRELRAPTGDVAELAEVLRDPTSCRFDVSEPLVNMPTTDTQEAIEGFFADALPTDLLLLYLTGHGVLSKDRQWFFATPKTKLTRLRATGVSDDFINGVMQRSRSRSIVLILDCCYSGRFGKGRVPKSTETADVEHRFQGRGRVVLTASSELEYALEEQSKATELVGGHPRSIFTRFLAEGLRSVDVPDAAGRVSVDRLYEYVFERVREHAPEQTPGKAGDMYGHIFLAYGEQSRVAAELRKGLLDTRAFVRAATVRKLAQDWEDLEPSEQVNFVALLRAILRDPEPEVRRVSQLALVMLDTTPTDSTEVLDMAERDAPADSRRARRQNSPTDGGPVGRSSLAAMPHLDDRSNTELENEQTHRAAAKMLLGARASERADVTTARQYFNEAMAAAWPHERPHIRAMAKSSLSLAEGDVDGLVESMRQLNQEPPDARGIAMLRLRGLSDEELEDQTSHEDLALLLLGARSARRGDRDGAKRYFDKALQIADPSEVGELRATILAALTNDET